MAEKIFNIKDGILGSETMKTGIIPSLEAIVAAGLAMYGLSESSATEDRKRAIINGSFQPLDGAAQDDWMGIMARRIDNDQ